MDTPAAISLALAVQQFEDNLHPLPAQIWSKLRVLVCEGDGIVSMAMLFLLKVIMTYVEHFEKQADSTILSSTSSPLLSCVDTAQVPAQGFYPCHYFDHIFGASAGGVIAIMLGTMRLTVDEAIVRARQLWWPLLPAQPRSRRSLPFLLHRVQRAKNCMRATKLLQVVLSTDTKPAETTTRRKDSYVSTNSDTSRRASATPMLSSSSDICQTTTFATCKRSKGVRVPVAFRSYNLGYDPYPLGGLSPPTRVSQHADDGPSLNDVALATMAAPQLFSSIVIPGYEGSYQDLARSDLHPATEALTEVRLRRSTKKDNISYLICLGTSSSAAHMHSADRLDSTLFPEKESEHDLVSASRENKFCFTRLDIPSLALQRRESRLADITLEDIEVETEAYCLREAPFLKQLARLMVLNRRRRAGTIHWEKFAALEIMKPPPDNNVSTQMWTEEKSQIDVTATELVYWLYD